MNTMTSDSTGALVSGRSTMRSSATPAANDSATVERIFQKAKQSNRTLSDREILECIAAESRPTVATAD